MRPSRSRHRFAAVVLALAGVAGACGDDGGAPSVGRSNAVTTETDGDATDPTNETDGGATDPADGGDPGDPQPGLTAALAELVATASFDGDACVLFGDALAEVVAPLGAITSVSGGPDTLTIDGADIGEVYCNVGTDHGIVSFSAAVAPLDADAFVDAAIAGNPDLDGSVAAQTLAPTGLIDGSFASRCITDASVADQCRYVWSTGRVTLTFADLGAPGDLDPVTAVSILESAVAVMSLTIV